MDENDFAVRNLFRKLVLSSFLSIPIIFIAMAEMFIPHEISRITFGAGDWIQFVLSFIVYFGPGYFLIQKGVNSVISRKLNMYSPIMIGVSAAYFFFGDGYFLSGNISRFRTYARQSRSVFRSRSSDIVPSVIGRISSGPGSKKNRRCDSELIGLIS
ncbi:hypothetical protein LEP1GSC050_1737 [Leptospira broomii serovar Hurstbridge str. 5399]|uniref:Uncharacterized protein n=1 Tax=Leptospira broomii serovar Hurstbridge str. 5399 TaxID=1049789 RepID=T0F866_9LEPT|nr:hypothetical protein LEP1GSC050_1737 [Leptospira broomii serovar Hurstbridge str. 5399]